MDKKITGRECKHIAYQKAVDGSINDLMLVKEVVHYEDNTTKEVLRQVPNYRRPFYITKKHLQNHVEKRECEPFENLDKYMATDANLSSAIQISLGRRFPDPKKSLRQVCDSPFVYYADFTAPMHLKSRYIKRYPDVAKSLNRLAILDIETNEYQKTKEPMMCSVVVDNVVYLSLTKDYYDEMVLKQPNYKDLIKDLLSRIPFFNKDTGKYDIRNLYDEFNLDVRFFIAPTFSQAFTASMQEVHKTLPDFLVIWNMDFDISKILQQMKKDNVPAEDAFCHPDVPLRYRKVRYVPDDGSRVTNNGTNKIKAPQDQWHVLECMASFYVIDAMSLYKKIRVANGNLPNYKLASILKAELGVGKLEIPEVPYSEKLEWHITMQADHKAEYIAYNIMDDLLIKLLDDKTYDISSAVSILSEWSPFSIFASLPKRLCASLTVYLEELGFAIGTSGSKIKNDNDEEVISLKDWIVTLPAHATLENGINCVSEVNSLTTAIRMQTADADLTQAYPLGSYILNQSRETRLLELCRVQGGDEWDRRRAGINLTGGKVNAIEIANSFLKMPDIDVVLEKFCADKGINLDIFNVKDDITEEAMEREAKRIADAIVVSKSITDRPSANDDTVEEVSKVA